MGKNKKKQKGHGTKGRQQGQRSRDGSTATAATKAKKAAGRQFPVSGLTNLGNTCFFNAVMQNISQSHQFRSRLEQLVASPTYSMEIQAPGIELPLSLKVEGPPGQLTRTLHNLLGEVMTSPTPTLNPKGLFSQICQKAPRFRGYQQQDSQELLRYLLDSLRAEEIYRVKRAILTAFNIGKKEPSALGKLTDRDRADIKTYGHQASLVKTFVDDIFGGTLISTVVCKECGECSSMHESFLDLSLPIPEDKSKQSAPSPVGGRGRKNRRRGPDTRGSKSLDKDSGAEPEGGGVSVSPPKAAPLSKHQQKKARKKQAKEARKLPSKKSLSLQEFLKEGSGQDGAGVQEGGGAQEAKDEEKGEEQIQGESPEITATACTPGAVATVTVNEESHDPGKSHDLPMVAEAPAAVQSHDLEGGVATRDVEGGQLPEVEADTLANKLSIMNLEEPSAAEGITGGTPDDMEPKRPDSCSYAEDPAGCQSPEPDVPVGLCEEGSNPGPSGTEDSTTQKLDVQPPEGSVADTNEVKHKEFVAMAPGGSGAVGLQCPNDSLEACLKKFCSLELLTGSNKFACAVCTKRKSEEDRGNGTQQQKTDVIKARSQNQIQDNGNGTQHQDSEETLGCGDKHRTEEIVEHLEEMLEQDDIVTGPPHVADIAVSQGTPNEEQEAAEESEGSSSGCGSEEEGEGLVGDLSHEESAKESDGEDQELLSDSEGNPPLAEPVPDVVYCEAMKQLLVESPPQVLNLHLKRFLQHGRHLRKNSKHISFPTQLDLTPFCTPACNALCDSSGHMLYSLYGVVEHSGGMHGGHYTAYVRVRQPVRRKQSHEETSHEETSQSKVLESDTKFPPEPASTATSSTQPETGAAAADGASLECSGCSPAGTHPTFDLASMRSQWYYISDTHIRTATENEVAKSQAYLLFYERLVQ